MNIVTVETREWKQSCDVDGASRPVNLHSAKDIKHKISFLLQKPEPQAAEEKTATASGPGKRSVVCLVVCLSVASMNPPSGGFRSFQAV